MAARYANRTDANATAICEEFRGLGAWAFPMPPDAGFDYLIGWRGHLIPIEVKDGLKPPSARKLTEREEDVREALMQRGVSYWIVTCAAGVIDVLSAYE